MSQSSLPLGDVAERTVTRLIAVKLQPAELAAVKEEARLVHEEMKKIEGEFEVTKKEFNSVYGKLEVKLFALIDKQTENRQVECIEKRYFETNLYQVLNGDEVIEERALTGDERQLSIDSVTPVVLEPEQENFTDDLQDVMKEERSRNKASVVDAPPPSYL